MTQRPLHNAERDWVSAGTAASILDRDRSTITRLVQAGKLQPVTHIDHGKHRVPVFSRAAVQKLRDVRDGVTGDVLDRIDLDAAGKDPSEDRGAYIRDEWLKAIRYLTTRSAGKTFHRGQVLRLIPEDARGPESGSLVSSLVRQGLIEHTGDYRDAGDARNRHGVTPCKVYRVTGELP